MSKRIKIILIVIALVIILSIIFGIVTGIYDYNRVKNNMTPAFCITLLDRPHNNQTCLGLGYKVQRAYIVSSDRPFDKTQRFSLWTYEKILYRDIDYNDYDGNYLFTFKEKRSCPKLPRLYYTDKNDIKYYLYCLDEVLVNFDSESISLKEALETSKITIDEIIDYLSQAGVWYDGGTKIYKDKTNEYSKYGFSVLKCNAFSNEAGMNNNIYIGPSFMDYEESFCK